MVTYYGNHHSADSIRINGNTIISSDDFRMKLDTWYYFMACINMYPSKQIEEYWCESCRDSDREYSIDIPEEELQRLISVHKKLDNVLANYYNLLNHCV